MKKILLFVWSLLILIAITAAIFVGVISVRIYRQNQALKSVLPAATISAITPAPSPTSPSSTQTPPKNSVKLPEKSMPAVSSPAISIPSPSNPNPITSPPPPPQVSTTSLEIQGLPNYQIDIAPNDTAFSILVRAAKEHHFKISDQDYGQMGVFVECINNLCGNSSFYWAFYYNGQYSSVGASAQKINPGDITAWKYQS